MRSAVASGPPRRSQMLRVEKHDDSRRRNGIRSRLRTALACGLGLALLAPLACSGSGSQARSTTTSRPGPDRAPIVLGLINMENSANGSFPEIRVAAQAAVRRIDDHGGIAGRPLRLESCVTVGTPGSSRSCALSVAAKHPIAVLGGIDLGAASSIAVLERAGIPYLTGTPTLEPELSSTDAFALTGGVAAELLALTEHVTAAHKLRSVSVLYADLPGVLSDAAVAARIVFAARGVKRVRLVPEKPDAADFTTAVTAATAGNPDALFVLFPAQSCSRIMATAHDLGTHVPTFYASPCANEAVLRAGGGGEEGAYFAVGYLLYTDTSNREVRDYRATLRRYSRRPTYSVPSAAGYSLVMNTARMLRGLGSAPPTPQALIAALRATRDEPNVLAHPFTCDGHQIEGLVAVCNSYVRLWRYRNGRFHDLTGRWITGAPLAHILN